MARRINIPAEIWIQLVHREVIPGTKKVMFKDTHIGYFETKTDARGRGKPFGSELARHQTQQNGYLLNELTVVPHPSEPGVGFILSLETSEKIHLWVAPDIKAPLR